jgi:hypothetical protein
VVEKLPEKMGGTERNLKKIKTLADLEKTRTKTMPAATSPRLKDVRPARAPFTLNVTWTDGRRAKIDMTGVIHRAAAFAPLRSAAAFRDVEMVAFATGIGWPRTAGDLDYSAGSLERLAREQAAMDGREFRTWQDGLDLSNQETADLLELSLSTVKNYRRKGARIPSPVRIACRAMAEDPVILQAHFRPRVAGRPKGPAAMKRKVR